MISDQFSIIYILIPSIRHMLLDIEVDPEQYGEIMDFIKEKKYQNEKQFIQIAIRNLIAREKHDPKTVSEFFGNASSLLSHENELTLELSNTLSKFFEESLKVHDFLNSAKIEKSTESEPSVLIWKFYTRFFPIKLVVRKLATMMMDSKSNWIELSEFQDEAYNVALAYAEKLRNYEIQNEFPRQKKLSTGLPISENIKKGKKGRAVSKALLKIGASRKRFISQFIGRIFKKTDSSNQKTIEFEPGACFEMGLIGYEVDDAGDYYLTLTKEGKEFAFLENPIIDKNDMTKIFSKQEAQFILKEIIPRFKLEKIIVDEILERLSSLKQLNYEQINTIFEQKKKEFISKYPSESLENELKIFENLLTFERCPKCQGTELYKDNKAREITCMNKKCGYKIGNPNTPERVATMGRLAEIGVINWTVDDEGKSNYIINPIFE